MFVFEFKAYGKTQQYSAIDEAIRTGQFIRNKCLRYWMDTPGVQRYDLNKYCAVLAAEFPFADELNSMARQASAERAWSSIARFYDNCRKKMAGKKGYPKFKKNSRSIEYKTSGWKLSQCRNRITFSDKKGIGTLKLKGGYDLHFCLEKLLHLGRSQNRIFRYQLSQIKRVRIVRRADGYYVQFCVDSPRLASYERQPSKHAVGLDVGLKYFLADSEGKTVENPRFYRQAEKQLNRANRKKSKKFKRGQPPSNNSRLSPLWLRCGSRYECSH